MAGGMNQAPLCCPGTLVKCRWKVLRKIGQGAFGEIYSARNVVTSELVAIKVEAVNSKKQVLKLEVTVLKKLKSAGCPYVVDFITCGRHNDFNYMVMELLGENISELRRRQPNGKFSMLTTLKLGIQMLRAIEAVHELGYLHRDIKPSNYAMGLTSSKKHSCYLIDFGLARRYLLPNSSIRLAREHIGFRGTARYASINSHQAKDLGRRDDLWSLFYVLIEFAKGQLPWRKIKDKDEVGEMKMRYNTPSLVADLPQEFSYFMQHLQTLHFADKPNYSFLHSLLNDLYTRLGGDDSTPFDWERSFRPASSRPRPIPSLADLSFVKVATNLELHKNIPYSIKKRMVDFLIRINNGKWPRDPVDRLLDENLPELDLHDCDIEEADFQHLVNTCTKLRALSIGPTTDAMLRDLFAKNSVLEQLTITATRQLTSKGLRSIAEKCPQLQSLKVLDSDRITDKMMAPILRSCTALVELSLSGCKKFKGVAFKSYVSASKRKPAELEKLDLSGCEISKKGFRYVVKLCPTLNSLTFSPLATHFKISSPEFVGLIQQCENLTSLDLRNYHFEMDSVLKQASKTCTKLTTLLLDGSGMTDSGLQCVLTSCTQLEKLRFRYGDGVSDLSLNQVASNCSNLKSLALDFWHKFNRLSVTDQAIKSLLQTCTNLAELSLCNCLILTGACFPETGYFPFLHVLNLSDCIQLNDFAIRRIADSCPNLNKLELNNLNNITASSLESVSIGCPHLDELFLKQCACFKDEAMKTMLGVMPRLFMHVTRFVDSDLKGVLKEVHCTTVNDIFSKYPNTYRERAFERTRRRMFGMDN